MRLFRRIPMILAIASTVTAMLLGGGVVILAGDHEDCRHEDADCKGMVHVVIVDEDGERHEESFEFDGDSPRAFLGVHLEGADEGGAIVKKVVEDSAAERAGLQVGDVIVGIDRDEVEDSLDLTKRILQSEPGDRIDLEIMRVGSRQTLTAELGEHQGLPSFQIKDFDTEEFEMKMEQLHERLENLDIHIEGLDEHLEDISIHLDEELDIPGLQRRIITVAGHRPLLGVQLVGPTPELREHMGAEPDAGVLVSKVLPGMPAMEAGVQVGDLIVAVDGESVEDAGDLIGALRGMEGETIGLEVIRDGRSMTLDVLLPEREEQE
jgi:predicted metalloprotease with PDZ domain